MRGRSVRVVRGHQGQTADSTTGRQIDRPKVVHARKGFTLSLIAGVALGLAFQVPNPLLARASDTDGTFLIENYATGSATGGHFKRGYIFEVTQTTVVTGLTGAGTLGSTFAVGLYTASTTGSLDGDLYVGGSTTPNALLGSIEFTGAGANGQNVSKALSSPVTLQPGNLYLLAQMRLGSSGGGSHSTVTGLNRSNILTHPRIRRWGPTSGVYYWSQADTASSFVGRSSSTDSNLPRLGLQFQSDCLLPAVTTDSVSISGNQITFTGTLTGTGASGAGCANPSVELAFEQGTSPNLGVTGTFQNATPANITAPGTFSLTLTGLTPNTTYYYRAVAINEGGRSTGEIGSFTFTPEPQVSQPSLLATTATSLNVSANLVSLGTSTVTNHGVCIVQAGIASCVDRGSANATGVFEATLTGLDANSSYQV